jgi:hypothetical protein
VHERPQSASTFEVSMSSMLAHDASKEINANEAAIFEIFIAT